AGRRRAINTDGNAGTGERGNAMLPSRHCEARRAEAISRADLLRYSLFTHSVIMCGAGGWFRWLEGILDMMNPTQKTRQGAWMVGDSASQMGTEGGGNVDRGDRGLPAGVAGTGVGEAR